MWQRQRLQYADFDPVWIKWFYMYQEINPNSWRESLFVAWAESLIFYGKSYDEYLGVIKNTEFNSIIRNQDCDRLDQISNMIELRYFIESIGNLFDYKNLIKFTKVFKCKIVKITNDQPLNITIYGSDDICVYLFIQNSRLFIFYPFANCQEQLKWIVNNHMINPDSNWVIDCFCLNNNPSMTCNCAGDQLGYLLITEFQVVPKITNLIHDTNSKTKSFVDIVDLTRSNLTDYVDLTRSDSSDSENIPKDKKSGYFSFLVPKKIFNYLPSLNIVTSLSSCIGFDRKKNISKEKSLFKNMNNCAVCNLYKETYIMPCSCILCKECAKLLFKLKICKSCKFDHEWKIPSIFIKEFDEKNKSKNSCLCNICNHEFRKSSFLEIFDDPCLVCHNCSHIHFFICEYIKMNHLI